ncbi:hypothetical protein F5Y07DRAFT_403032 [Xylaria sp. FL0933]|nr:hypothetical protein F5Y07DRAFT_403032 [Xylaria sp. FL0933]
MEQLTESVIINLFSGTDPSPNPSGGTPSQPPILAYQNNGGLYPVEFRHVNCKKRSGTRNSVGCEISTAWRYEPREDMPADADITVKLSIMTQHICRDHCKPNAQVDQVEAYIVWNGKPPATLKGKTHQPGLEATRSSHDPAQAEFIPRRPHRSSLEPHDLELIHQRDCGDYIQVDFVTKRGEKGRWKRVLHALVKLGKRFGRKFAISNLTLK